MNNKSCTNDKHKYGLWNIDNEKKCAWRICDKCQFRRELPITLEVKNEIKKQEEACKLFKAFQLVDNNDKNILNYLDLILDDYANYLSKNDFSKSVKRVKELEQLDIIDTQNVLYQNKLETYFEINDIIDNDGEYSEISPLEDLNINTDLF